VAAFFNAIHEKVRSFNLKVYLLINIHFKQRIRIGDARSYEYEWLLMDLDALANLNSPYVLHYYGALLREVC